MTVLIDTDKWLVEYEARHLFITNRETGLSATMQGTRIASDVRSCLRTHTPDRVAQCYAQIADSVKCEWARHYKRLPKTGEWQDVK